MALAPIDPDSHLGEALRFFVYDTPKVLMLLTLVVFGMGVVRSFFSPEKTRALLAGKREGAGNVLAAGLGIFTPFCSCSAVPMFIGFVSAGVPLGITFSFLISAPMVNEVALGLLFGLVGWKVALTYLGFGLFVAIAAGWVIGRLHLENWLEEWVRNIRAGTAELPPENITAVDRIKAGIDEFGLVLDAAVRVAIGQLRQRHCLELGLVFVQIRRAHFLNGLFDSRLIAQFGPRRGDQGGGAEREHARDGQITTRQFHGFLHIDAGLYAKPLRPPGAITGGETE